MPKERYGAEEIIHRFRKADVLAMLGMTVTEACKQQTYYRWRKEQDDMKVEQLMRAGQP